MIKNNNRSPPIQTFNNGVLAIYSEDKHDNEKLVLKHALLRYDERTVGMNRFHKFKQDDVEISLIVRIPRRNDISVQDVAILQSGQLYRITQVQYSKEVTPACCDLSLERISKNYDLEGI